MAKKLMSWKTKGMNRDLSVSAFNPEFAFENKNLRLSTNEGNTLMSWVTEKGPKKITIIKKEGSVSTPLVLKGSAIGTAVINDYFVLFTSDGSTDHIYRLEYDTTTLEQPAMIGKELYCGNLKLEPEHPLETLVSYESDDIQKVYWVDGINQPRVINIVGNFPLSGLDSQFDFIVELQLNEKVKVKKMLGANGTFAPGVIQYCFTYYSKHGQESNIFYTTPLYYISHKDRGAAPDEKVANAFKITVEDVDSNFEYMRIYSIQRTSINSTPFCKRIQDIALTYIENNQIKHLSKVSYTDTGTSGDSIDPTELLYKGGESITASTLEQKDNTLFLGNITLQREDNEIAKSLVDKISNSLYNSTRVIYPTAISTAPYAYESQLTAYDSISENNSVPCAGFKYGDYYRLGIQFQDKTGRWSKPICISDHKQMLLSPKAGEDSSYHKYVELPVFEAEIKETDAKAIEDKGFVKVRPLIVLPEMKDRIVLCQGVVCPTLRTESHEKEIQSSWFFRTRYSDNQYYYDTFPAAFPTDENRGVIPGGFQQGTDAELPYTSRETDGYNWNPVGKIKGVEIEGDYNPDNKFKTYSTVCTMHSPDVEFDTAYDSLPFAGSRIRQVGQSYIYKTLGDIDIQTESPAISNLGAGFIHKDCINDGMKGIVAGAYYDDVAVDESSESGDIHALNRMKSAAKWIVYPWQGTGSLNNDINRPAGKGTSTAILKKKVISNLRFSTSTVWNHTASAIPAADPQMFSSDEVTILKSGDYIYKGNIDTSLIPDHSDGKYFVYDDKNAVKDQRDLTPSGKRTGHIENTQNATTSFNCEHVWKTFSEDETKPDDNGLYSYPGYDLVSKWDRREKEIGDAYLELVLRRNPVRMKYKSTAHLLLNMNSNSNPITWGVNYIPVVEIVREESSSFINGLFGGDSKDAFMENKWIPCGEPVRLNDLKKLEPRGEDPYYAVCFEYSYGDTYFQRWDCLKTYAFTPEDINQVVEIGSFMLESHINLDGRYDRNRGQQNNLNMSPRNFNLMNDVYSQQDNFFTYRILDDEEYTRKEFPNQITWTKTKESGADVDLWTNITLASTLELDGDKGKVNKLIRLDNQLLCFQDIGISQVLYNESTQITTTDGVPIEIANSGKVQGKRYISNTIGCSNKWSIATSPSGIYFMDDYDKSIFLFNGQLNNLSTSLGFNSWCKQNINKNSKFWSCYDKQNQEVLFINEETALAYSEKVGAFTSFYDYQGDEFNKTAFFNNLVDTGVWSANYFDLSDGASVNLWQHQTGEYCKFFGEKKPYWMTLVGNPEPQLDKTFTNIEFRACVEGDGEPNQNASKFTPALPFDSLETWNEYQHGIAKLNMRNGHNAFVHHVDNTTGSDATLKRKFRIWRCDIPRDNAEAPETDSVRGISRYSRRPMDRMRNPWLYLQLMKNAEDNMAKAEIHDIVMTYFG